MLVLKAHKLDVLPHRPERDAVSATTYGVFDVYVRRVLRELVFRSVSETKRRAVLTPLNDIQSSPQVICTESGVRCGSSGERCREPYIPAEECDFVGTVCVDPYVV